MVSAPVTECPVRESSYRREVRAFAFIFEVSTSDFLVRLEEAMISGKSQRVVPGFFFSIDISETFLFAPVNGFSRCCRQFVTTRW